MSQLAARLAWTSLAKQGEGASGPINNAQQQASVASQLESQIAAVCLASAWRRGEKFNQRS